MKRILTLVPVLLISLIAVGSASADVMVGLPADPNNGNCYPFGCLYSQRGPEYQQIYSQTQFSGPITITGLEFFNTQFNSGATAMNSGTWTISLSTTGKDWNSLSGNYAANLGTNNTQVFSGNLSQPWAFGDTLHIPLATPFTYDPTKGNLLMDVQVGTITAPGGGIWFDTNGVNFGQFNGNNYIGRVYGSEGSVNSGYGLVTNFATSLPTGVPTSVPEPGTVSILGVFAGIGLVGRRILCR
jgi:hypothetical protein